MDVMPIIIWSWLILACLFILIYQIHDLSDQLWSVVFGPIVLLFLAVLIPTRFICEKVSNRKGDL